MEKIHVLFVGESWFIQTTETKGVDYFTTYRYEECAYIMKDLFEAGGIDFTHIPSHRVEFDFPETLEELQKYDIVMFSDVGANTFLLPSKTFLQGIPARPPRSPAHRDAAAECRANRSPIRPKRCLAQGPAPPLSAT